MVSALSGSLTVRRQRSEHHERETREDPNDENEADAGGGLTVHDIERRVAGGRDKGRSGEREIADDVDGRWRRVDSSEAATRGGSGGNRSPDDDHETEVEGTRHRGEDRSTDRE